MPATSSAIELKGGTVKESKGAEKKEGSSLGLLSSSPSSVPSWFSKGGPGKAGCLSTLVWWWVNPLVDHASRHPISKSMLWPLAESHTSDDLLARFDEEWKRQIESGWQSLTRIGLLDDVSKCMGDDGAGLAALQRPHVRISIAYKGRLITPMACSL
eukprot:jgi/Bigna1/126263/aug1.2_g971